MSEKDAMLLEITAAIVAAYVTKNSVRADGLPDLIASVSASIAALDAPAEPAAPTLVPAVNPKKSVFPDYIISLENGKRFKSLKRNLSTSYGMTPEQYRTKWGLPADYPMTAPNYAAQRSALAKASGLGRKADAAVTEPVANKAPVKRGRPKKAKS